MNKTAWEILSLSTLATETESGLASCSTIDLTQTVQLAISISNMYNESNVSAARLRLYTSHDNTSTWDSDPYAVFDSAFESNTTQHITVPISPEPWYIKATVENRNLTGNFSSISVIAIQGTI